jgi:hypothetical protein
MTIRMIYAIDPGVEVARRQVPAYRHCRSLTALQTTSIS